MRTNDDGVELTTINLLAKQIYENFLDINCYS